MTRRTIRYRNGTVQRVLDHGVETDIPGLPMLAAGPAPGQEQTARDLGYGDDVAAMNRGHDVVHGMLADWLGLPYSYSLASAAGGDVPAGLAEAEEAAAMAVQRFARLALRDFL